ncbi:MAG: hypothetical protein CMP14_02170 [Rickettsiales bacterium]|nr:hypothetical protein [Rickettsiales bacterium]
MMSETFRFLVVVALGAILIGCSGAADTTRKVVKNLNPVNWFGDDEDTKEKGDAKEKKDRQAWTSGRSPGQKPFPRLGDVQSKPKRPTPEQETQKIAKGLAADTQNAKYSEQELRQSAAVFGGRAQPRQKIRRSQAVPIARSEGKVSTSTVSRPATLPTLALPGAVRPPQPVQAQGSKTGSSLVQPPASMRVAPPPRPIVSSRLVKKPAPKKGVKPLAPALVKGPQKSRITPPPISKRPTLAPPPPTFSTPRVMPSVPSQVRQARTVGSPTVARKLAPSVTKPLAVPPSAGFVTPVGQPSNKAKPPPAPQPLRGPANGPIVAVAPPSPAQLSRNVVPTASQKAALKSVQVGTIYFSDGSDRLSDEDVSIIAAITQAFVQTGGKIRVVGHSSIGSINASDYRREKINFKMSLRRAHAVADALIRQGVPRENIEMIAEGDRAPVYEESTQTGAAYNRRAEIFIDYQERS